MRCCHYAQMGSLVDQFLHLRFGFLVCLLPFGILQSVADTCLMDIGDAGTKNLVLPAQLVHLVFEFAVTLLHAVEQSVSDTLLHTVKLVLVGGVCQINLPVSLSNQLFLV